MLYKKIDAMMIHAMRRTPKMNPCTHAAAAIAAGMLKTVSARTIATTMPLNADTQTRRFNTSRTKNSVRTGNAETNVDSCQKWSGS